MFLHNKKMAVAYWAVIFFVGLDRFLKILALTWRGWRPELIGDIFKFGFTANHYVAFSLPLGGKMLLVVISLILAVLIILAVNYWRGHDYARLLPLATIILGAASNLFDRLKYGYVVDYLDLKYFTIFNLADIMILAGVIYWLYILKVKNKLCINLMKTR